MNMLLGYKSKYVMRWRKDFYSRHACCYIPNSVTSAFSTAWHQLSEDLLISMPFAVAFGP